MLIRCYVHYRLQMNPNDCTPSDKHTLFFVSFFVFVYFYQFIINLYISVAELNCDL